MDAVYIPDFSSQITHTSLGAFSFSGNSSANFPSTGLGFPTAKLPIFLQSVLCTGQSVCWHSGEQYATDLHDAQDLAGASQRMHFFSILGFRVVEWIAG